MLSLIGIGCEERHVRGWNRPCATVRRQSLRVNVETYA